MKIASWNVNSIRSRTEHVIKYLQDEKVDVLCLQEIKCQDQEFPSLLFESIGYKVYSYGQKAYNGVAILTKVEPEKIEKGFSDGAFDEQKRIIMVKIKGLSIYNVYVPNGASPDDDKFLYKNAWYKRLKRMVRDETGLNDNKVVICGDFNVAPDCRDVVDPKKSLGRIGFHPDEHKWFNELLAVGLKDCFRNFTDEGKIFSWWDYRADSFKNNKGMRIDHFLTNKLADEIITKCYIDSTPRGWDKPTDHAPIIIETKDI